MPVAISSVLFFSFSTSFLFFLGLPGLFLFPTAASAAAALSSGVRCVLECFLRWSDRVNPFPQFGHLNRRSSAWMRRCRVSSSDRVKVRLHPGCSQVKGRSLVWVRRCAFRCDVFRYTFPQPGWSQQCSRSGLFLPLWCFLGPGGAGLRQEEQLQRELLRLARCFRDGCGSCSALDSTA